MSIDPKIVSATAYLLHDEAQRAGRGWEIQGITAAVRGALEDDGRQLSAVVRAGFETVADSKAQTPGAMRWPARYATSKGTADWQAAYGPECAECGKASRIHDEIEAKLSPDLRHPFRVESEPSKSHRPPHASGQEGVR